MPKLEVCVLEASQYFKSVLAASSPPTFDLAKCSKKYAFSWKKEVRAFVRQFGFTRGGPLMERTIFTHL